MSTNEESINTYEEEKQDVDNLLVISQLKFELSIVDKAVLSDAKRKEISDQVVKLIIDNEMLPYYKRLHHTDAKETIRLDTTTINKLEKANQEKLKSLDDKIKDAEENFGENEVREALLAKAVYYHKIGDKDNAISAYRSTETKTVALGQKLDIVFALLRIGFSFMDYDLVRRNIEKAKSMIEEGGDWERRNKLKVYEGLYLICIRNYEGAAKLYLESVATFSSYEIMTFNTFIFYTIITAMITLDRPALKKKVIDSSEILTVIEQIPHASNYVNSLYNTQYQQFMEALADISDSMKLDRFLSFHARYYTREMRVLAYSQFLEPYKSITLASMSKSFGLPMDFLDRELSRFVAAGRLTCKIDKVAGVIESSQVDDRNNLYQQTLKHGDLLLNRVQKLSRVIDL